jgi:hypothetical protein
MEAENVVREIVNFVKAYHPWGGDANSARSPRDVLAEL